MSRSLRSLIERQIQKARLEGKLDGLKGTGKPLPAHPEEAFTDKADAAGFRIMAQAGVLPEEIELKKKIAAQKERLKGITDLDARKQAMRELAHLELRHGIATDARKRFLKN